MTFLEKVIKDKGPILSGDLIQIIENQEVGISNEAIRKRLSRVGGNVSRLKGFFSNGQILFYDKEIFGTEEYFDGLIKALKESGKQYYTILRSLGYHNGQIRLKELPSYSVSPVLPIKGHMIFDSVLKKLKDLNLVNSDEEFINLTGFASNRSINHRKAKGIEVAKNFLLVQFNDWSRKLGLVSYKASTFHSEFGKYQFNFVAPSYIGSLANQKNTKIIPAFVVADIMIGNNLTMDEVAFFVKKVQALKAQKNLAKFIPFLIIESIEPKGLNYLKQNGVVIGFVNELFGSKYVDLLNSLVNMITNAGAILKKDPEAYLDLITKLNKLVDGKTNNLRGDLFELAVGYYHGRICNSIDIGKVINFQGKQREIDVFGLLPHEIYITECKGYKSLVDKDEVENWLKNKVPIIRKWILDQASLCDRKIKAEFWSTGGFTEEALEFLRERKNAITKYDVDFYDLDQMLEKSSVIKSRKFTDILKEYYVKEI